MADKEIINLNPATVVSDADLLLVRQNIEDKKVTISVLKENLATEFLRKDDNLAGILDKGIARENLSVYSKAEVYTKTETDDTYTKKANNLDDVADTVEAFNNIKQLATTEATGVVEKATLLELQNGAFNKFPDSSSIKTELDKKLSGSSNLGDLPNKITAFNNIKQAATETSTGVVEKATSAELQAGTANKFPDSSTVKTELDKKLTTANNLSDVPDKPAAFNNIKQVATTSSTGVVEVATIAEMDNGTSGKFPDANNIKRYVDNEFNNVAYHVSHKNIRHLGFSEQTGLHTAAGASSVYCETYKYDGTKMYTAGVNGSSIILSEFDLNVPHRPDKGWTHVQSLTLGSTTNQRTDIDIAPDASRIVVKTSGNQASSLAFEVSMPTSGSLTGATTNTRFLSNATFPDNTTGFQFYDNGNKVVIAGGSSSASHANQLVCYSVNTPYTFDGAAQIGSTVNLSSILADYGFTYYLDYDEEVNVITFCYANTTGTTNYMLSKPCRPLTSGALTVYANICQEDDTQVGFSYVLSYRDTAKINKFSKCFWAFAANGTSSGFGYFGTIKSNVTV